METASKNVNRDTWHVTRDASTREFYGNEACVTPKPFDNKPGHPMCCHLAIGSGTKILPIQ